MYSQQIKRTVASLILTLSVMGGAAHAASDPLIEGGRLCTQQFPIQEQQNNIPTHLLAAISTTESGRWHDGLGMAVPWPWTINVDGKGYYFKTKAEAIAQTRNFMAQGHQSIDVGCMQVNLKHHNKAFANLDEAFDPKTNVAYAAKFLHDNYAELGDWIKATAAYHSRTQVLGQQYLAQIERSWNKIVAKVAAARASQGITETAANAPAPTHAPAAAKTVADANAAIAQAQRDMTRPGHSTSRVASSTPPHSLASTHNVQVIQVADGNANRKSADIMVIRGTTDIPAAALPAAAPVPAAIAPVKMANADEALVVRPGSDSVRRVALDNATPAPQLKASPASFVFAN